MAYTKYSLTPANNNATPPDGAPEGMLPSAVNDTMRDMMAQIRDCGDGIRDGTYTMTAPKITGGTITGAAFTGNTFTSPVISGGTINNAVIGGSTAAAGTFTSLSDSGNLTFTGTGNRITGDFSNATVANRVAFQTSTTNGNTGLIILPNGTGNVTSLQFYNNSDTTNASSFIVGVRNSGTESGLNSGITGTGTYLPITMLTGGSERLRIDTSGNVGIGTSSPTRPLHVFTTGFGVANFIASGGETNVVIQNTGTNGRNWSLVAGGNGGAFSSGQFGIYDNTAAAARLAIDSSGNVGIGTSSPRFKLSFGSISAVSTATPDTVDLGGTFSSSAGANGKLRIWYDGGQYMGFGVSSNQLDYICTGGYSHVWYSNSAERMRIDSSGNVLIGGTTSYGKITAYVGNNSQFAATTSSGAGGGAGGWQLPAYYGSVKINYIDCELENGSSGSEASVMRFATIGSGTLAERMRITSSGALLVGTTNVSASAGAGFKIINSSEGVVVVTAESTNGGRTTYELYSTGAGAYRFYVGAGGTIFATSTTISAISDERLKENIRDLDVGIDAIMAVKPRKFDWKEGKGLNKKDDFGFVAQEFETVFPNSVTTSKAGADGIEYKTVNHSELIPTLVKAIQEQQAMIEELKQEVATLKSN